MPTCLRPPRGAGQRVGAASASGVPSNTICAAALAGAGAYVDQAVGGQHHRRVVLHHHQVLPASRRRSMAWVMRSCRAGAGRCWARRARTGVDQRGAQRRGQVDALHLAAAERAALAVQRQVADAHVAQVFAAACDLVVQQAPVRRALGFGRRWFSGACSVERPSAADRSASCRPGQELAQASIGSSIRSCRSGRAAPPAARATTHALGMEARFAGQHGVRIGLGGADAPQQARS